MLLRAPRIPTIPLPHVNPPFFIWASLAASQTLPTIDFASNSLAAALVALSVDEASRPATSPATNVLRIVHPSLADGPILVYPRPNSSVVTVYDVLSTIYNHLWSPLPLTSLNNLQRQDAAVTAQERCLRTGIARDHVRRIDLFDGATLFAGLDQDIVEARQLVGQGIHGIDQYQALTWILRTREARPTMGLGPHQRWR
ncbi:hypothetical protein CPB86DRAFT_790543 [Serendipita vermifera]|nr:hypothetical protein CPB86DRAFT_790543 [Serendipita vermifera]